MRVWISARACSPAMEKIGIYEVDGEISTTHPTVFVVSPYERFGKCVWHLTKEEALARAQQRRQDTINCHRRSIARLERLIFS